MHSQADIASSLSDEYALVVCTAVRKRVKISFSTASILASRVPGSLGGNAIWLKVSSRILGLFAMLNEYGAGSEGR